MTLSGRGQSGAGLSIEHYVIVAAGRLISYVALRHYDRQGWA